MCAKSAQISIPKMSAKALQENLKRTREKLNNYKRGKKPNLDFIIKDLDKLVLGSAADNHEYQSENPAGKLTLTRSTNRKFQR